MSSRCLGVSAPVRGNRTVPDRWSYRMFGGKYRKPDPMDPLLLEVDWGREHCVWAVQPSATNQGNWETCWTVAEVQLEGHRRRKAAPV